MAVTLTKEDGTGLANSNAYTNRAFADVYHENLGRTAWATYTNAVRDSALIQATLYLDAKYAGRFRGTKADEDQALEWPREDAVDPYGFDLVLVPSALAKACAELALYAAGGENLFQVAADGSAPVGIKRVKRVVGPITKEIEYAGAASARGSYPQVAMLLAPLLQSAGLYR